MIGVVALAYKQAGLRTTAASSGVLLLVYLVFGTGSSLWTLLLLLSTVILTALCFDNLRRTYISAPVFDWYRKVLPGLSDTEREAIEAGTVWWEGDLFSGQPDWSKLLAAGPSGLSPEELYFVNGPLEELCGMVDSWKINHELADIPKDIIAFIKEHKFLGLIIPKEYGGLELSAVAQVHVLTKLFGISNVVGNFISVPNSLGPGELLVKYGTEEQKQHYLPRLAAGDEIPCFALTGPLAGSDATSLPDTGVVCKQTWKGKKITGIRLNFDKRYITLAPVATLIGLAFRLQDPDHLLGEVDDYGITCALIPRETPGLEIGNRHFPMGDPFLNGPVRGRDVFVPLDTIIGGPEMAGKGWRMLVNCLSAGRSIALPSISNCLSKRALAGSSAYARIRRQFKLPIARFEGIQKPLARITGLSYIINAACVNSAQAIDAGEKPAVVSSILKYHCTEMARRVALDAADIHAGKGVMKGPKNYLSWSYEAVPVAITVEGANILTRSLMIFGQGATRCHPYVLKEMSIAAREFSDSGVSEFDGVLLDHIGFALRNSAAALVHALTGSLFTPVYIDSPMRRYYQYVSRLSAAFALVTDAAMLTMQGSLRRREMLSARLGDLLSMLFLTSMVLKHFEDQGCPGDELPVAQWACRYLLHRYQEAMYGLLQNFPNRFVALKLRAMIFPLGGHFQSPSDDLERRIAQAVVEDGTLRDRLIRGIHLEDTGNNPLGFVNDVFREANDMAAVEKKLHDAIRAGRLTAQPGNELATAAEREGILEEEEARRYVAFDSRVMEVIGVDEFPYDSFARSSTAGARKKTVRRKKAPRKKKTSKTGTGDS
jgi:acyl-CoA dehydrogenase